jgi:hypothetical protein
MKPTFSNQATTEDFLERIVKSAPTARRPS